MLREEVLPRRAVPRLYLYCVELVYVVGPVGCGPSKELLEPARSFQVPRNEVCQDVRQRPVSECDPPLSEPSANAISGFIESRARR